MSQPSIIWTQLNASYWRFISTCILDCFSWPFGPSETICPKNSFRTTHNVDMLESFKTNQALPQLSQHSCDLLFVICNDFVFQATPKLWSISENISKNPQVWKNFGPRSPTVGGRGRPPFVENIANNRMPHCLSLGGRLFLREFWQSRRGRGPSEPSTIARPYHTHFNRF